MSGIQLKGLKGLSGLNELLSDHQSPKDDQQRLYEVISIPVEQLQAGVYQPRITFDEDSLRELAESIREQGIIQPLIVRKVAKQRYEIIAGERRWRASKLIGLKQVPAIIRDISDQTALAFGIVENLQRKELDPIEQANAYKQLGEEFCLTHAEIAKVVGTSRVSVTHSLRLLNLPDDIQAKIKTKVIEVGHAKLLLSLEPENLRMVVEQIIQSNLTVRQAEKLIHSLQHQDTTSTQKMIMDKKIMLYQDVLKDFLNAQVLVNLSRRGKCKVTISLENVSQLESLVKKLKKQG